MENRKTELIPIAATELVNRINNEIEYIFEPRYTDFDSGKRSQNNPFVDLDEASKTEVVIEAMTMVLGQIGALALSSAPELDFNLVFNKLTKRAREHGDAYHQMFLKMKETQDDAKAESKRTEGRNESSEPVVPSI